ncbi:MAG: ribosome small subunit-dependent GTPase A [Pseudomonadota bacterium]
MKSSRYDLGFKRYSEGIKSEINIPLDRIARVIAQHKELYIIKDDNSEYSAQITGKMMFEATSSEDYPAVGDWLVIEIIDSNQAIIKQVLPRMTYLKRKAIRKKGNSQIIASNIDKAIIVQALGRDYSLNRFERYVVIARQAKIDPILVLNKIDLITEQELSDKILELKDRFVEIEFLTTSTVSKYGIDSLNNLIKEGLTYCFLGSSGVGKSSLINTLLGKAQIKTCQISDYSSRGKHITTHRQLFVLESGGILIDNPGMRELGLTDSSNGLNITFDEIKKLSDKCQFVDCTHIHEPGCAVLEALEAKELSKDKYNNYIKLKKETDFYEMNSLERKKKDKAFGKFCKNVMKHKKKEKY